MDVYGDSLDTKCVTKVGFKMLKETILLKAVFESYFRIFNFKIGQVCHF